MNEDKDKKMKLRSFKDILNDIINYIKENKIFSIINGVILLIVILGFIINVVLGFLLIILWLLGIIVLIKSGGYEKMVKKKKGNTEKAENKQIKKI